MRVADLYWLAGIYEGEGWFGLEGDRKTNPRLVVAMTDADVIQKVAGLVGARVWVKPGKGRRKTQYWAKVSGSLAVQWMMTLFPLMGERRKKRIQSILAVWKRTPGKSEAAKLGWATRRRKSN